MIIVADRDLEKLRHRLTERDVTIAEVHEFIQLQHRPMEGQSQQFLADFIKPEDLQSFWWLVDWWEPVQNKPQNLPTPSIIQFCWYVNYTPGTQPLTFFDLMGKFYETASAYCVEQGLDPKNLGESKEERVKRLNRERMREARGHRRVPDKKLQHDDVLLAHVRGLEDEIEGLKTEQRICKERFDIEVKHHYDCMMEASERRKEQLQDYKQRIDVLVAQKRSLTEKQ